MATSDFSHRAMEHILSGVWVTHVIKGGRGVTKGAALSWTLIDPREKFHALVGSGCGVQFPCRTRATYKLNKGLLHLTYSPDIIICG